LYGDVTD